MGQITIFRIINVVMVVFVHMVIKQQHLKIKYPINNVNNFTIFLIDVYLLWFNCKIFNLTTSPLLVILYCLFTAALLLLSIIDLLTYEIPIQINLFIGVLGIVRILTDLSNLMSYLIGFFCISGFLYIIYVLTKGKGIGGGDIKLMAVSGLVVGFPNIVVAFLIGCILGSVIHTIRCKVSKADHVLAFGPYLSAGLVISILYGEKIIQWYVGLF